jgi:hypothetical protein
MFKWQLNPFDSSLGQRLSDLLLPTLRQVCDGEFGTFWQGPLDPLIYSCMASFPHVGARLRVYSYDPACEVPSGVELADARAICPNETLVGRYIADGKSSLAKFSDLFRYRMIWQTGLCWVDTDMLCLRRPDFSSSPVVFGRQLESSHSWSINCAVLKLPPRHPILRDLIKRAAAVVDIDQPWGIIGPALLTELARKHRIDHHARQLHAFYPVPSDDCWKPLLPEACSDIRAATRDADFLHLWHESFRRYGMDKWAAPPPGSFLHEVFQELGTLERFRRSFSEAELNAFIAQIARDGDGDDRRGVL